nr:ATP-binding protein [uncultured Lacibacter sp.]
MEEMEKAAREALVLARKLNYTKGEGYALLVNARVENRKQNKEAAAKLLEQADAIAKQTGDQILQWRVVYRYTALANNSKAQLPLTLKAEEFAQQIKNNELIARSQTVVSSIYYALGDYALAMEYGIKSMKTAEGLNDPLLSYQIYDNMATIYSFIGEHDKASEYLQKLPALIKQLGFGNEQLANLYNALGENARFAKKYKEAIDYYNQSIAAADSSSAYLIAIATSNLGDVYLNMDSLALAFKYVNMAKADFKKADRSDADSWVESILARAYFKKNMLDSALYYAKSGYSKASEGSYMEDMLNTSKVLADAYALKNDYKSAYSYFNRYISTRDSITGAEVKNKTTVLEHNYEIEKKQDQIELLRQQKKGQRTFLISVSIILGLIVLSSLGMLRSIQQKQKANKLLQKQKQEIDEKAKELSVQKDNLQQSYNNVELLGEIGRKITSSLSVDKIISTVYDNVNALMDASIFGIGIYHDDTKSIDFPATYENGKALPAYSNSIYDQNRFAGLCFISGKEIVINDLGAEYSNYLQHMPTPIEGQQPVSLIYLPLKAKEKMFGVITVQSFTKNAFSDYHLYMLRTIGIYTAIALENAESYKKLTTTVNSLQETQKQLIQSEKMASLGELTAGIAHEIQNPLNFVNNFSEVSAELIHEMNTAIEKGDLAEAKELAHDIKRNLEKISHHGKRADGIVKGMLQHSRNSSGIKEAADINALADEYLRLAYHGLRAKDKTFNATMKTDFDENIGTVHIFPQDMGRVILNLITNAFYVVNEKKKSGVDNYEPTVTVTTKKLGDKVEVSVKDNGNGIPEKVFDKIFQPFFTTKPTGQGTGLGLSLSYDIVKAHGGELKVETKENEGTIFRIILPV